MADDKKKTVRVKMRRNAKAKKPDGTMWIREKGKCFNVSVIDAGLLVGANRAKIVSDDEKDDPPKKAAGGGK